jgi:hypothetical protein
MNLYPRFVCVTVPMIRTLSLKPRNSTRIPAKVKGWADALYRTDWAMMPAVAQHNVITE